jgi:hypothetical protein
MPGGPWPMAPIRVLCHVTVPGLSSPADCGRPGPAGRHWPDSDATARRSRYSASHGPSHSGWSGARLAPGRGRPPGPMQQGPANFRLPPHWQRWTEPVRPPGLQVPGPAGRDVAHRLGPCRPGRIRSDDHPSMAGSPGRRLGACRTRSHAGNLKRLTDSAAALAATWPATATPSPPASRSLRRTRSRRGHDS